MTNSNLTHIIYILDRSGSMIGCKDETVNAFDEYINSQKELEGEARLSVTLFDAQVTHPIGDLDIKDFNSIQDIYTIGNVTALYDAIGKTIDNKGKDFASMAEDARPGKVLCIIHTDGMENASSVYNASQIREMIQVQKTQYNWEFVFLGEQQDAWLVGNELGVNNTISLDKSAAGLTGCYNSLSVATSAYRSNAKLDIGNLDCREPSNLTQSSEGVGSPE